MQICPEDIRWDVEEDPSIVLQSGQVASRHGVKRTTARGGGIPGAGRGRGSLKNQKKKDFLLSQNSIGKKSTGNIEILQTDTLIKEVCVWDTKTIDSARQNSSDILFVTLVHPR